jgi:ankyrin repeat protein
MVRVLLTHGADINAQDKSGLTALMEAVIANSEETVSVLLDQGAEKTIKNNDGQTALDIALKAGNKNILTLLK